MAGEIEIAGEVLTVCPIALGAQTEDAVCLASLVNQHALDGFRDGELPPRYRALMRHARVWASLAQPAPTAEV